MLGWIVWFIHSSESVQWFIGFLSEEIVVNWAEQETDKVNIFHQFTN